MEGKIIDVGGTILLCTFDKSNVRIEQIDPTLPGGQSEVTTIKCYHSDNFRGGEYFTIASPLKNYVVWYEKDGRGEEPYVVHATNIMVPILTNDTAPAVANKTVTALLEIGAFTASVDGTDPSLVRVTNTLGGDTPDAKDFNSNFKINVEVQGQPLILYEGGLWIDCDRVLDMTIDASGNTAFLILSRKTFFNRNSTNNKDITTRDSFVPEYRTIDAWPPIVDGLGLGV